MVQNRRWWLAAVCCVVYASMWIGWVHGWSWLMASDDSTLALGYRIGVSHHGWVTFWDVWCTIFSPATFRILTAGLIVFALVKRRFRVAAFLFVAIELSGVLTELLKALANRPRPSTAAVDALSTSFPSGHALGTVVAVLALAVVLLPHRPSLRPWVAVAGVVIVVFVGAGRVALNVHHLSDIVAGWAIGYVYFVLCLLILRGERGITARGEIPAAPDSGR